MKISDIGGEFALIERLTDRPIDDPKVIKGVGDDCAVLDYSKDKYLLVTTDMMVEGDHFSLSWQTSCQVGKKLVEINVSDIVAMGGTPQYAFISISLKKDTEVEFMEELYRGIYSSAQKHNVILIGGDTTHGTEYVLNLTLLGEVEKNLLRLRSMAEPNDLICVTGTLGGSTAGLKLLIQGKDGFLENHLEPKSRLVNEGRHIACFAHAMIDVSDGLASEVTHICNQSNVGAQIDYKAIPISKNTLESARVTGLNPYDFALYGGEDFEIVFTLPEGHLKGLREHFTDFTVVGKVLDKSQGLYLLKDGKKERLKRGYDHFA